MNEKVNLLGQNIHSPIKCRNCGEGLEYKGVGEYQCPNCNEIEYDDYGKVRNYLESHRGATQMEVAKATGVPTYTIRELLRNDRIEVAENSSVMIHCEICGSPIRSGRYCDKCKAQQAAKAQAESRHKSSNIAGFGKVNKDTSGAKRFNR